MGITCTDVLKSTIGSSLVKQMGYDTLDETYLWKGTTSMTIDPTTAALATRLAELTVPSITADIYSRIKTITAGRVTEQTVSELRAIIDELMSQRNNLIDIAREYETELISQLISDTEMTYIINTLIPAFRELAAKSKTTDPEGAAKLEENLDLISSMLSAEMLKVLQLVGFNFKRAIGEPLTELVAKLISAQFPATPENAGEIQRLNAVANASMLQIAQDADASERLHELMAMWRHPAKSE